MKLKEITDCCRHLKVKEKRCLTDEFVEMVFYNEDAGEWNRVLQAFLGPPSKPEGQKPTARDLELTAGTGGIRINQTLFEKDFEDESIVAKFWPWKDRTHTTLRMALLQK
ncbi:MAG: hypothetical protein P8X55_00140 [Desulfosarcinaceae bacterium]